LRLLHVLSLYRLYAQGVYMTMKGLINERKFLLI